MSSSVIMRGQYVSHQASYTNETPVTKLKQCTCCPYGYHIDLDFVNYCEQLAANARPQSDEQRQRREKRRQRKSMEVMLGVGEQLLQHYSQQPQQQHKPQQQQHQQRIINCIPELQEFYSNCERNVFESHEIVQNTTSTTSTYELQQKNAFVKDILFDVCSDFDRTFERTKKQIYHDEERRSYDHSPIGNETIGKCVTNHTTSIEDQLANTGLQSSDKLDGVNVRHHKLSKYADKKDEKKSTKNKVSAKDRDADNDENNVQLQKVRQQMALSLSRMRELEEQVKIIPKLRQELSAERAEKRNLHTKLKEIEERKSFKIEPLSSPSQPPTSLPTVPVSSIGPSAKSTPLKCEERLSTKLFSTQRVCATSLESLNMRFQNNSSPTFSMKSQGSVNNSICSVTPPSIKSANSHKDIGCMTNAPITRDVGTLTINQLPQKTRTESTNTTILCKNISERLFTEQELQSKIAETIKRIEDDSKHRQKIKERLFTETDVQSEIQRAIEKLQNELAKAKLLNSSSIGVQCVAPAKQTRHIGTVTDRPKTPPPPPPCIQHSIGIMAVVDTRNAYSTAKPEIKSIGLENIATVVKTRCTGTDPIKHLIDVVDRRSSSLERNDQIISLKSLDMLQTASSTVSHVSNKELKEPVKIEQNSVSIQCSLQPSIVEALTQPTPAIPVKRTSIAIQHSPRQSSKYSQCQPKAKTPPPSPPQSDTPTKHYRTEGTDTKDLIRLNDSSNNTDAPPKTRDRLINTERIRTVNGSTNTTALPRTVECGTNPVNMPLPIVPIVDKTIVTRTDTGCGTEAIDIINKNCNTCLAKIEIKQQTFFKNTAKIEDAMQQQQQQQLDVSRIPRPTALISPRPERKFTRQNTYTISPTSPTSPTIGVEGSGDSGTWHSENISQTTMTTANDAIISELIAETVPCSAETLLRITSASRECSPVKHRQTGQNATATNELSCVSNVDYSQQPGTSGIQSNGTATYTTRSGSRESSHPSTSVQPSTSKPRQKAKPTKEMQAALKVINDSLQKSNQVSTNLRNANKIVQIEWFRISSTETAQPLDVEDYLDYFEEYSTNLLKYVVNLSDANGNTAMHYAISHGNFDVVSILLDSKVCCVNQTNNAGYTCVMLVSLAKLVSAEHHTVVQRLFQMSDVNIRAKKHHQTALMLAVSHGNYDMVQMLLEAGADINIQDEDGSTALMCAAEHGRIDIIKLLLAQPDCDSTIQDVDGSSALKISLEAGYRDIGVLLYAHEHMSRNKSPYASLRRSSRGKKMSSSLSSSTNTLGGSGGGGSGPKGGSSGGGGASKQTP